jgi:hypothetical protein
VLLEAFFRYKSSVFRTFMHVFAMLEKGFSDCFQQLRHVFAEKPIFACFRGILRREVLGC